MSELELLQQWMLTVLATPTELSDGLARAERHFGLNATQILRPGGAPLQTRLMVYANSYLLRLVLCLEVEYPALRAVLGEELFNLFAAAYVWETPSRSTTLYDLGRGLPDFLARTQGEQDGLTLPLDLARLERARAEVGRSRGIEQRPPSTDLRLERAPNAQVLHLGHPLLQLLEQVDRGEDLSVQPAPRPCTIAVSRAGYQVFLAELRPWQVEVLSRLPAEPASLLGQLPEARLLSWLEEAQATGLVTGAGP